MAGESGEITFIKIKAKLPLMIHCYLKKHSARLQSAFCLLYQTELGLQEIDLDFVITSIELNLEKSEIDLLQELQRNTSDRLTYQKLTTLLMLHKKYPISEIVFILGVDNNTIY
jgi:hypothetical protein